MDRDNFLATYHIDASNNSITYTCHDCGTTMALSSAQRHVRSLRHLKKSNKGKCRVDLYNFIILNNIL